MASTTLTTIQVSGVIKHTRYHNRTPTIAELNLAVEGKAAKIDTFNKFRIKNVGSVSCVAYRDVSTQVGGPRLSKFGVNQLAQFYWNLASGTIIPMHEHLRGTIAILTGDDEIMAEPLPVLATL